MNKSLEGKKNRNAGLRFERKVRADLESKGWIVDKWTNNVYFELCGCGHKRTSHQLSHNKYYRCHIKNKGRLCSCNLFSLIEGKIHSARSFRGITRQNGFPDFIVFRKQIQLTYTELMGVESKMNGVLSKVEKEKCE